jgi:hypothetical protein
MNGPDPCKELQDELDRLHARLRFWEGVLAKASSEAKPQIASEIHGLLLDEHVAGLALSECRQKQGSSIPSKVPSPLSFFPTIVGVEKTQAVQVFPFNGQGAAGGRANSIPMIDRKLTLLRVYVDYFTGGSVTGVLRYDSNLSPNKQTIIPPRNVFIQGQPRTSIIRAQINDTLNFVIPSDLCTGARSLLISIGTGTEPPYLYVPPDQVVVNPNSNFVESDQRHDTLRFEVVAEPPIHGVLVHYTGPDGNGQQQDFGTATLADLRTTLDQVKRLYPVKGFNITGHETINFTRPQGSTIDFTRPQGSQGMDQNGWNDLLATLNQMAQQSGGDDRYYALVPGRVQTPAGLRSAFSRDGTIGYADIPGSAASGFDNLSFDPAAQELAHTFGRGHAVCSVIPGNIDPNYPTYGSYRAGSIGEVGADPRFLQAFDPAETYDFMSYCRPYWVSPYTYLALLDTITRTYRP